MSGDYTRLTHRPAKRYVGVLMQQGRVQVDADWNEQVAIDDRRHALQAIDTFGLSSAVPDATNPGAFRITPVAGPPPDLSIEAGRIYTDGILAEILEAEAFSYLHQPFYPDPPALSDVGGPGGLAYLDVWQREVTFVEDPDLLEVALGGPDTATRLQTVWQVKVHGTGDVAAMCDVDVSQMAPSAAHSGGRLSSQAVPPPPDDEPCDIPPSGGYRGLENRLYRVEIHTPGDLSTARFKWSRDNGSVGSAVEQIVTTGTQTKLTVSRTGLDPVLRFHVDDWVELTDDHRELNGEAGEMARVTHVDEAARVLTLDRVFPSPGGRAFGSTDSELKDRHTRVRRWDQQHDLVIDGAVPTGLVAVSDDWTPLEDGIQVKFALDPASAEFRVGDYWVVAARTVDGSVDELVDALPRGIIHHYCVLGSLDGLGTASAVLADDCRTVFPPLSELVGLFVAGGDGQEPPAPGQPLDQALRVWTPLSDATALFEASDNGTVAATVELAGTSTKHSLPVLADANSVASCGWKPNPSGPFSQTLTATLLDPSGTKFGVPVVFTANLSIASQVGFDPANCTSLAEATTVQEALDILCAGGDREPGFHVIDVLNAQGAALLNDAEISVETFRGGIEIVCDEAVDPAAAEGEPTCFVSIEMPYPLSGADRDFWGDPPVVGFQPLVLAGSVKVVESSLLFTPEAATVDWLSQLLQVMKHDERGDRLLARFTLQGSFIWSQADPRTFLDGDTFGAPGDGRIDLLRHHGFLSGDGRRGGDFKMWFWLI